MKKIIIAIVIFVGVASTYAQEIKWVSLNEAIALQKKNPKKIIMDVYTNWCPPCKMLDKKTFHNKDVVNYINENFYAVKLNGEGNDKITYKGRTFENPNYKEEFKNRRNSPHQLASVMNISAYPTIVFFDENADIITPLPGYRTPQQLEVFLKFFHTDKYKEVKTQEDFKKYLTAFKPVFVE